MSNNSPLIRQLLQILNENVDDWGNVLNVSALRLLEDSIAGMASVDVGPGNVVLDDSNGGPSIDTSARHAILNVTGTPGAQRTITIPGAAGVVPPENKPRSKLYLVYNNSDASVLIQAAGGGSVSVDVGEANWVWCDGTDALEVSAKNATNATTATTATNSTQLGGIDAADYAQLALTQAWTAGQYVARTVLSTGGNVITPDLTVSNHFYSILTTGQAVQLQAPSNPQNGQVFSLVVQQPASGTVGTLSYATNTYIWEGGNAPTLTPVLGAVDYFGFEYCSNIVTTGGKWIGSAIRNIGPIT